MACFLQKPAGHDGGVGKRLFYLAIARHLDRRGAEQRQSAAVTLWKQLGRKRYTACPFAH